jgi:putative ABC transport system ATP-binding protein
MVKLTEITKNYTIGTTELLALDNVSLSVAEGDFVSIMGASGSGKSTLMNIIGCLDNFDKGTYHLDNIEVSQLSENQLADIRNQKIGFVFQNFNLLSKYTAQQNVELPMIYASLSVSERHNRAQEALERVGLEKRAKHRPNEMSGGEKQRVAIARALVNRPSILLADEPTGNLDSHRSKEIMEIFSQLNKEGVTIILVTHESDIALYSHRVIHLFDGHIISDKAVPVSERLGGR